MTKPASALHPFRSPGCGAARATPTGCGRHHRLAGVGADVLRGAVRGVLHHPQRDQLPGRARAETLWESQTALLNIPFAIVNTTVLVASSFTCQMGVFAAERGQVKRSGALLAIRRWGLREWYVLTYLMGSFFIGGQVYEYAALFHESLTISTNVYGSVFFLATGFHGLHVTGGLIAFMILMGRTFLARTFTHEQAVSAVVVSYYWHFVDVVWIALFGVIYILQ